MLAKTILITGASAGIGKSTAKLLAGDEGTIYVAAPNPEQMEDLKELGCIPLKMDITIEEDVQNVISVIEQNHGGVDILINNAGYGLFGSIEETSMAQARHQFDVNVFGLARLTQLVLPRMRENRAGKIINVSSVAGKVHAPLGGWYVASKHAVEGWTDCLRFETKAFNIDVVLIEPGVVDSEFANGFMDGLLKISGDGPYANLANAAIKFSKRLEGKPNGASHPSVISNAILSAVRAKKPQTRYVRGKYGKLLLFSHKWLSDRGHDWLSHQLLK